MIGFDIAHEFDTRPFAMLPPGRGILIGNTRALWPHFTAALPELPRDNPLEAFTERAIGAAHPRARIFYAHRKYNGSFIPFQRIAVATGLGALAPCHLVIHPEYGPWFALRAIVVVDGEGPVRAPIAQPCRCEASCTTSLDAAFAKPGEWRAWLAVRDACSLRAHRYSDDQILYHYTHAFPGKR
jgi:methylmalonic aciduria homocystinuria type C protein